MSALTVVVFCVFFVYSGSLTTTTTTPSQPEPSIEAELTRISDDCFSSRDNELLAGDIAKHGIARLFAMNLLKYSAFTIGRQELRLALNFSELGPWGPDKDPSESEIASAPSLEAYYELKEPRDKTTSTDSLYFYEKNIATAIAYMDKRLPSVRRVFKLRFEEMKMAEKGQKDRKQIDRWIDEMLTVLGKINDVIRQMDMNDRKCWTW